MLNEKPRLVKNLTYNIMKTEKFYYQEWKEAEKEGNIKYANNCKEQYRLIVMENLKKPYKIYIEALKAYPPIYLN